MKKSYQLLAALLSLVIAVSFMPLTSFANVDDDVIFVEEDYVVGEITMVGSGSVEDPYQIYDKYQFDQVRNNVKASYILMKDIIFTDADFQPSGDFYNDGKLWIPFISKDYGFRGNFDGNGHTIEGIKIGSVPYASIFGGLHKSTIQDLTLRNIQSQGEIFAVNAKSSKFINCIVLDSTKSDAGGGFINRGLLTTFQDCVSYVCITDTSETGMSGGIVGDADGCTFNQCKNYGNIVAKYCAGGIVGRTSNSYANNITSCENYGNITALDGQWDYNGAFAGGIVGEMMASDTAIKTSFNNGTITGETHSYSRSANAGGIAGQSESAIIDCYNSGTIVGAAEDEDMVTNIGGISGVCKSTIVNSFNSGKLNSVYRAGGITAFLEGSNARISRCYNVGDISAVESASGVVNKVTGGATVANAYYLNESVTRQTSKLRKPLAKKHGTALTKKQMQKKSNFKKFNFSSKWTISSKKDYKYPTLKKVVYKPQMKAKSIKMNFSTRTMQKNKTYRLKAIFTPSNTTNKLVRWSSSNPKVAKVDATGKVTALKSGTTTITCKTRVGSKRTTSKIYVVNKLVRVTKVNIVKTKTTVKKGKTKTLTMKVSPSNASETKFIWKTSNKKIVTVTSTGKIKGIKKGKATITCIAADGSGKKDTCVVTVN